MDEMVFQCNNQNSIYVLNSNYGIPAPAATATTAHGEFRGLGLIDAPTGCRATSLIGSGLGSGGSSSGGLRDGDVCSSVSRSLQDKLKNLGNFNGALLFGGNNGTAAATTTYSPASSSYAAYPLGNSSNNNSNTGNSSAKSILHPNNGLKKCNVIGGGGGPTSTGNMNGVVKSNLIAKKTKFWKYLEEEKLRNEVPPPPPRPSASHCSVKDFASCTDCYSPTDAIVCADGNCCDNSCVNKSTAMAPAPDASQFSSQHHQQQQSNNNKEYHHQQQQQQQQYTSNNWSRNHDSNNLKPQQQQQQQQQTQTQKSKEAAEMYKEAAELLGLTCTLCDNCRCLDCQSGYFDCDDSDSYSEFSLMDEYDVDDLDIVDIVVGGGAAAGCSDDYGAAQNMSAAAYANSSTTTHKLLAMHADNMTALCCDILHSQQAATYERQAEGEQEVDEDEGAAFCLPSAMPEGEVGGRFVVDEEDASRRISATVMTGMHQLEQQRAAGSRAEGPGTSSGTDEMNTAAITSASSSRISSDGPTEPTIDQVALHNIKGTMLPQATDAAAAARPTPPTTNTQGMAKGCGVRGNDLENCSNFDGLRLSDSYGPGARR